MALATAVLLSFAFSVLSLLKINVSLLKKGGVRLLGSVLLLGIIRYVLTTDSI